MGIFQQPHERLSRRSNEIATPGTTFKDKNALLTGVGNVSITTIQLKTSQSSLNPHLQVRNEAQGN